jgi:hypothetical protein
MSKVKDQLAPAASLNGTRPTPPANFISYTELMQLVLPEREWVIENVIPVGLVSGITAESGAGKTWLALKTMRDIAEGAMWAGKHACKPRTCGLLDLEGDYITLKSRLHQMHQAMGDIGTDAKKRLMFLSDLGRINILEDAKRNEITNRVRSSGLEVLFVDTLIRTHAINENDAAMSDVMEALERIARETTCTVIVLHHAGKGSNGRAATSGRGSSAIKAALQHEIMLTRETDQAIKLSLTKAKSAPEVDRLATMTIRQTDGNGVAVEFSDEEISIKEPHRPSAKSERREAVIALLTDLPLQYTPLVDGVMGKAKCARSTAALTVSEMEQEGTIEKGKDGRYDLV